MSTATPLSRLIREAREALNLSQADLAKKVGVDAGVNVSKWESGTPIPWHRLDALLKALPNIPASEFWMLVKKHQLDAMLRYQKNRLKSDEQAPREAHAMVLDFLPPRVRAKIESLHGASPYVSIETLTTVACEWYADMALAYGLRADLTPNLPMPDRRPSSSVDQADDGETTKKEQPGHIHRKMARRG